MELYGWGRYPRIEAEVLSPSDRSGLTTCVSDNERLIARGLGRSYGDSSLAECVISTRAFDRFIAFNPATGYLTCDAGVTLSDILEVFVPQGWFLSVTPGTRYVSVGGAIASDVHGKNHHLEGTFCQHVQEIALLLGNGEMIHCSSQENSDLFYATCGGMGLTGIILTARIRLRRIQSSQIIETTVKARDLDELLAGFEHYQDSTYSVAWIDCLAKGKNLGRSLLMLGEHAEVGDLCLNNAKPVPVPINAPNFLLNEYSIKAFNAFYYKRVRQVQQMRLVHFAPFFYPLDKLENWNRLYGKKGFVQYQFVLPKETGRQGMTEILQKIAASGRGSFLAVLKVFGKQNLNYLSFPMEGYTLALDFKVDQGVFDLLLRLDQLVLDYGGRIYLTKDARMSEKTFKAGYPNWEAFQEVRGRYHALGKFTSIQSGRLGLR